MIAEEGDETVRPHADHLIEIPAVSTLFWLLVVIAGLPLAMARTFNCGIGMTAVVARSDADAVSRALQEAGEAPIPGE